MHLTHAKDQRAEIKEILKLSAMEVLSKCGDSTPSCEEFNACIDKWVCNHEDNTESSQLMISNNDAILLRNSVSNLIGYQSFYFSNRTFFLALRNIPTSKSKVMITVVI
jgi:hypothetical protein